MKTVLRWRCKRCDEVFTAWAPAERHAATHVNSYGGHGARIELEL